MPKLSSPHRCLSLSERRMGVWTVEESVVVVIYTVGVYALSDMSSAGQRMSLQWTNR